jgi:hypothetical protein
MLMQPAGSLMPSADGLKNVMVDHFRKVVAKPAEPVPLSLPNPIPAMLFGKPEVMPSWFDGLMAPMDPSELVTALSNSKLVSSPGEDEDSTGLWKLSLNDCSGLADLVSALFNFVYVSSPLLGRPWAVQARGTHDASR